MDADRKKKLQEQYKQRKVVGGIYRIRNTETGRFWMNWDDDLTGAENRHNFAVMTNTGADGSFVPPDYAADWKRYGGKSFAFERLEELEMKPDQSRKEFTDDLKTLLEMWEEKTDMALSYR